MPPCAAHIGFYSLCLYHFTRARFDGAIWSNTVPLKAQEIAEAVLDAETKIGELTSRMEKAQGFASIRPNGGENAKTKTEQLKEIGITHAERFETLAKHPEAVEEAKADAREQDKIVTRQDVLNRIFAVENETKRQQEAIPLIGYALHKYG